MCLTLNTLLLGLIYALDKSSLVYSSNLQQDYDICSPEYTPVDLYLSKPDDFVDIYVNWPYGQSVSHSAPCVAHVQTCDHCRIRATAIMPFVTYPECWKTAQDVEHCIPQCVYLYLYDAEYMSEEQERISYIFEGYEFTSQSKNLNILACGSHVYPWNITMKLRLTSLKKVQQIFGDEFTFTSMRTIYSPYFPRPYARNNEHHTYKFHGYSRPARNLFITVTFDDWLLAPSSTVQFEGANIVNRITGENIRPYIISNGHSMTMTFSTGEPRKSDTDNFPGFKAVATFYNNRQDIPYIETDCDRSESTSGGIMHLNTAADGRNRDCIWIIKKVRGFDGVYLKVLRYRSQNAARSTTDCSLEVRGGLTSAADQRLFIRPNDFIPSRTVRLSEDGFYIRLMGSYHTDDSLLISYAMYKDECDDYKLYYKCDNGRCIPEDLKCDSYDHCGDGSDEIRSMCEFSTSSVSNSSSTSDSYSIGIYVVIPLVVSIVVFIGLICLFVFMFHRCRRLSHATFGRFQGAHAQQARGHWHRGVQMSVTLSSGDHPPSYDEVIQSPAFGHLNMAFSWTPCEDSFTQPPSYEEAISTVSNTTQPNDNISAGSVNNSIHHVTVPDVSQQNPAQADTQPATLDTQPVASSASSGEDSPDRCHHPPSSDTVPKNRHSHIPTQRKLDSVTDYTEANSPNLRSKKNVYLNSHYNLNSKRTDTGSCFGTNIDNNHLNDSRVRDSNTSSNFKRDEDSETISHLKDEICNQCSTDTENMKCNQRKVGSRRADNEYHGSYRDKDFEEIEADGRFEYCDQMLYEDEIHLDDHRDCITLNDRVIDIGYGGMTDSSRSQDYAGVSSGSRTGQLMRLQNGCTGAADKSTTKQNLGRLVTDGNFIKGKFHKNSESFNYLEDNYRRRRHGNKEYNVTHKQNFGQSQTDDLPQSKRDSIDLLKPSDSCSGLKIDLEHFTPDSENTCSEFYGNTEFSVDDMRNRDRCLTRNNDSKTKNNGKDKMVTNTRFRISHQKGNLIGFGLKPDQSLPRVTQKAFNCKTGAPVTRLGSVAMMDPESSDTMTLTPGPIHSLQHNHAESNAEDVKKLNHHKDNQAILSICTITDFHPHINSVTSPSDYHHESGISSRSSTSVTQSSQGPIPTPKKWIRKQTAL